MLPKPVKFTIIVLMVIIGLMALYSIFNAGNPDSLLRYVFPDTKYDVLVAFSSSLIVFVLGFFIFFDRDRQAFHELVKMNADRIKQQRAKGRGDEAIADDILKAMGSISGYRHNLARKKLLMALAEFTE